MRAPTVPRIALVTCRPGPQVSVDRDLPVLVRALEEAGARASAEVWDDDGVDWGSRDLLDQVRNDEAAEQARRELEYAFRAGKATSRPHGVRTLT
ncbi:hypothetical protein [Streptomyces sp. AC512_CC834]|uniref:hypothetical protein n=1 Tax=Streptomyces sp. AC512_CC834 TaxID=2823691 RepID=UPI001C26946A